MKSTVKQEAFCLPPPRELAGECIILDPSPGLVLSTMERAFADPAYRDASPRLPETDFDVAQMKREALGNDHLAAYWAMVAHDREVVGILELLVQTPAAQVLSAGYWVAEPARRRGIATEAMRLLTEWVACETEAQGIDLEINPQNRPSRRVAEKASYEHRGPTTSPFGVQREEFWELYSWRRP